MQYYLINYLIFDKDGDGKSTGYAQGHCGIVLINFWYATTKVIKYIDEQEKIDFCTIKRNRLIKGEGGYQRVENLN